MTTFSAGLIRLSGPTLADAVPLDFRAWDPGEDVSLRPTPRDGWRLFTAELATTMRTVAQRPSTPARTVSAVDPRTCCLRRLWRAGVGLSGPDS